MVERAVDVAIVGAGISGLICAQQLQQAGYQVVVLEKSRGVGGRLATRRIGETRVDHGVPSLEVESEQPEVFRQFVRTLLREEWLIPWPQTLYRYHSQTKTGTLEVQSASPEQGHFAARTGINAIAKVLAQGLDLRRQQRVVGLHLGGLRAGSEPEWQLAIETSDGKPLTLAATAVVLAIPAPQALSLCEPLAARGLAPEIIQILRAVEYTPCWSAIAGYSSQRQAEIAELPWQAVDWIQDPVLAWLGLESSKRPLSPDLVNPTLQASQPILVCHSSPTLAAAYLQETDVETVGQILLAHAAGHFLSWFNRPDWLQVHRWRYALCRTPYAAPYLIAPLGQPLLCCGDWCGGHHLSGAFTSGVAAAGQIKNLLSP